LSPQDDLSSHGADGFGLMCIHYDEPDAPEVECIGKGKAAAPYEFGVKASIVTNNRRAPGGLLVLHASAMPDNPYDGHTLRDVLDRTETLTGCLIERAYVDKGYRGHDAQNPRRVARRLRCHQARAAPPLRHRARHRTPEGRRSPRPLLPQGPQETPTSSSQPWATTSAASSPG
jgi:transposase, IS5 family